VSGAASVRRCKPAQTGDLTVRRSWSPCAALDHGAPLL